MSNALQRWVDEAAALTQPKNVYWCDGSEAERDRLIAEMLRDGVLLPLDSKSYPDCYLHRSHPSDVARSEHRTRVSAAAGLIMAVHADALDRLGR